MAECVFSAPFYLQNLLDKQRFPAFPINDPASFLSSLIVVTLKFLSARICFDVSITCSAWQHNWKWCILQLLFAIMFHLYRGCLCRVWLEAQHLWMNLCSSQCSILESAFVVLELSVISEVGAGFSSQDMLLLLLRVSAWIKYEF